MKEKIIEILMEINDSVDYECEQELIDKGFLDSFDVISLVNELDEAFDIEIGPKYLVADNFNNVAAIEALVNTLCVKNN